MANDQYFGPINPDQNRDLDPLTVQRFCTGCPYKAVRSGARNPSANGTTNPGSWGENLVEAPMLKLQYYCTSPQYSQKTMIMYLQSSTVGFGYCPFFLDKWKQLESNHDPDDPPQSN
jgi:hypothetical protein